MKIAKLIAVATIFSFLLIDAVAQDSSSIILKTKVDHKTVYYLNGKIINHTELDKALKLFPDSKKELKISSAHSTTAAFFVIPGMVMVAGTFVVHPIWWAAGAITGNSKEINKTEAVIGLTGLGLLIVGFPFIMSSEKHLTKSVRLYNNHFTDRNASPPILTIGLKANGAGIVIRF